MSNNETALVIMSKAPQPGSTKTRLSPPLTSREASDLYQALLLDTIAMASELHEVDLALTITPPDTGDYFKPLVGTYAPTGSMLIPVGCPHIGICLQDALNELFHRGYRRAFALNSDGPSLPPEYMRQAFRLLGEHDLVLGPARDGGYYLIGMHTLHRDLFQDINWSTDQVLAQTLARAAWLRLRVALTPEWYDVDTAEDLVFLMADLEGLPRQRLAHTRSFLESANLIDRLP